jgi:hypothetical protein
MRQLGKIRMNEDRTCDASGTRLTQQIHGPFTLPDIVQRDDGAYALGWHDDAPGPFESRAFAQAVAAQRSRRSGVLQ